MKNKNATLLVVLLLLTPLSAFAYVDPGSGMMAWQGLLATCGAGVIFFGRIWLALKSVARRLLGK